MSATTNTTNSSEGSVKPTTLKKPQEHSAPTDPSPRVAKRRKKLSLVPRVKRDLGPMMYGFGDVPQPASESIDVLFDMVQEFVGSVAKRGLEIEHIQLKGSAKINKGLTHKPLVWSIRRDRRLHERILELLASHKTIKETKKLYKSDNDDDEDYNEDDEEESGED
jgi:transcription initiation factor TFIID subunit 13